MTLLVLAACHVFEVVDIPCTAGMACAEADADTDADSDTDTDTDSDTDVDTDDTAPIVVSSVGFVVSLTSSSSSLVRVYSPDGPLVTQWDGFGSVTGAVGYDHASGNAYVVDSTGGAWLAADGATSAAPNVGDVAPIAAEVTGEGVWVVSATDIAFGAWGDSTLAPIIQYDEPVILGAVRAPDGGVWYTRQDGAIDLLRIGSDGVVDVVADDFDTSRGRARIVFAGPEGSPFVCTNVGAAYAVAELVAGRAAPTVYYAGGLTDVSACGYDPGDDTFLFFSPSAGIVRTDRFGRGQVVVPVPAGSTFVRANFF